MRLPSYYFPQSNFFIKDLKGREPLLKKLCQTWKRQLQKQKERKNSHSSLDRWLKGFSYWATFDWDIGNQSWDTNCWTPCSIVYFDWDHPIIHLTSEKTVDLTSWPQYTFRPNIKIQWFICQFGNSNGRNISYSLIYPQIGIFGSFKGQSWGRPWFHARNHPFLMK